MNTKDTPVAVSGEDEEHIHKFVIPVEWAYTGRTQTPPRGGLGGITYVPSTKRVTKLRCECGTETMRLKAQKEGLQQ